MTTFQTLVYSIIHGMTEFLPLGSEAHEILVPYLIGWQPPSGYLLGTLTLGSFLALFIYFRHDWASMISSLLQVILFRRKPMTVDERIPLFLFLTAVPTALAHTYFQTRMGEIEWTPLKVALLFGAMGIPIWLFDSLGRKTKATYDWNGWDALVVGVTQATAILPGFDPFAGVLVGALFLNYRRDAAAKYAYFALTPILFMRCLKELSGFSFQNPSPMPDVSWLSLAVALIVSFFAGILAIGGFMKHVQQKSLGQYVIYRWILAAGVCLVALY